MKMIFFLFCTQKRNNKEFDTQINPNLKYFLCNPIDYNLSCARGHSGFDLKINHDFLLAIFSLDSRQFLLNTRSVLYDCQRKWNHEILQAPITSYIK